MSPTIQFAANRPETQINIEKFAANDSEWFQFK